MTVGKSVLPDQVQVGKQKNRLDRLTDMLGAFFSVPFQEQEKELPEDGDRYTRILDIPQSIMPDTGDRPDAKVVTPVGAGLEAGGCYGALMMTGSSLWR